MSLKDEEKGGGDLKKAAGADLIIPLLSAAFAIYYASTVWELPWAAKANGLFLGGVLLILVAIFLVATLRSVWSGKASLSFRPLFEPFEFQSRRLWLTALMIIFIMIIPWLGFTLTIFAFLMSSMFVLGVRSVKVLVAVSLTSSLVGYGLFILILDTPFPHGPVEALLGRLF